VFFPPERKAEVMAALLTAIDAQPPDLPATPHYIRFKVEGMEENFVFSPHKPDVQEGVHWTDAGMVPVWRPDAKRHPHALIGAGRSLAEHRISELISRLGDSEGRPLRVYDVGSNAERFRTSVGIYARDKIAELWHGIPVLQFGDAERLINARKRYPHCTCLFEQCTHRDGFDVFVFQHSLYYFTPQTLLDLLPVGSVALASLHHIFDAAGSILGQLTYFIDDEGLVDAVAAGNPHHYRHADVAWLKLGYWTDGNRTLAWSHDSEHFGTHVYTFHVLPTGLAQHPAPTRLGELGYGDLPEDYAARLNNTIANSNELRAIGPAQTAGAVARHVPVRRLTLKMGLALAYQDGGRIIAFPTDLVGVLASHAAMVPRTPTLERSLAEIAKRYLRKGHFPPSRIDLVVAPAVAAALVSRVEEETATIGRLHALYEPIFHEHALVMAGRGVYRWRWYHWFSPTFWWVTCRDTVTCDYVDGHHTDEADGFDLNNPLGPTPGGAPTNPVHSALSAVAAGAARVASVLDRTTTPSTSSSDADAFDRLRSAGFAATLNTPVQRDASVDFGPRYEPKASPTLAQDSDSSVTMGVDHLRPPPEPRIVQALLAFSGLVPTTVENNAEALVRGFRARLGMAVPPEREGVWRNLSERLKDKESVLYRLWDVERIELTEADWQAWLSKFPEKERVKFVSARAEMGTRDLVMGDLTGSAMIKVEKSGMCTPDGPPKLDERLVLSYKPIRQVATGPYNWLLAKAHRRAFGPDVMDNAAYWANGENAEASVFGQWFDSAVASFGDVPFHIYVGDQRRFEAHRKEGAFRFALEVAFHAVKNRKYQFAMRNPWLVGRAQRFEVAYKAKYVLGSGGTETSIDSMERNLAGLVWTFGEPRWGRTIFFFNGDDWVVMTETGYSRAAIQERMLDCGFETDAEVARDFTEIEFCQTLPYPVDGRTVWGPKIGRVLGRLPYAISTAKEDPAGVALGMRAATSHIPFLRAYMQRVYALSPNAVPIRYEHHVSSVHAYAPGEDTYAFVFARYGLSRQDEDDFKALLLTATRHDVVLPWAFLEHCYEVDN